MKNQQKQFSTYALVIYLISALLFLTSFDLHIHTDEAAVSADHGQAVSISTLEITSDSIDDEITVGSDSVLKVKSFNFDLLAVYLLIAIMAAQICLFVIAQFTSNQAISPQIPFNGIPPLRAPPQ